VVERQSAAVLEQRETRRMQLSRDQQMRHQ
jgi:hypothetical protein